MAEAGADARLAQALAAQIQHMIAHGRLDARCEEDPGRGRPIRAGDILVLVRRRNADFFDALQRYDSGELVEAGPAGCDSDKCLLPLAKKG